MSPPFQLEDAIPLKLNAVMLNGRHPAAVTKASECLWSAVWTTTTARSPGCKLQ